MPRVGPYARISDDDEQLGLGVARQIHDIGAILGLRGHQASDEDYIDNDRSAYQPGVVREKFELLLEDFKAGVIDGIAAYDLDRLARKPSDLERIIDAYDQAVRRGRTVVFLTVQGNIDLATPDGRTMARVLIAFANKASMDTARRVARRKLERAMNGESTSNFRAFGWNNDGSLKADEADLLREAIRQVFAGIGLPTIALSWNRRGIKTVRGKEWHSYTLRRVLSAPRIAGFAVYKGTILISEGQPVKGTWTPLLPESEWRVLVELVNPRAGAAPVHRKRYLLSGIARCGLCGMGMVGGTVKGTTRYMCRPKDSGGCAGVGINGDKLDWQVTQLVLAYLKDHRIEEVELPKFPAEDRLADIGKKIAELMHEYRQGGMSAGIIFPEVRKLEEEQRRLQAEQSGYARQQKRATTVTGEWPDLDLDEQRAVILSVLEAVVVRPTGRGGGGYRPERVEVVWL